MYLICDLCKGLLEKPKLNCNAHGYNSCSKCRRKKAIIRYRRWKKLKMFKKND